eukprot:CAMPEP_0183728832 /NCGR_PEP_ID=MMETSP0737-20130205/29012_1 /TAXON_ID=385413 /ORGANISM="Thalassiosira miniscula, Strain CCMP1093" /LENGTH=194 /DNA_ID=CAMNT_0025960863 /DNA_START=78 /DNA_END=662 /DNA_ORIENTATION=+
MREGRRFILGFLLIVTLALLSFSNIPLAYADDAIEESSGVAEAEVDAAGDVQVEEPEPPEAEKDDSAAAEAAAAEAAAKEAAEAEAAAKAAAEAEAAAKASAEAEAAAKAAAEAAAAEAAAEASAVAEETGDSKGTAFVSDVSASAKSKAMAFVDKAKEVTPEQMKKVAAGALGIWGVAAGAGWVMNNLGGAEE